MLQNLALGVDVIMELNVELTSAPRSTIGNMAYILQLAALLDGIFMCCSTWNLVLFPLNSVEKIRFLQHYRYLC